MAQKSEEEAFSPLQRWPSLTAVGALPVEPELHQADEDQGQPGQDEEEDGDYQAFVVHCGPPRKRNGAQMNAVLQD